MKRIKVRFIILLVLYAMTLSCSQPEPEIQTLVVYGDSRSGHQAHRAVVSGIMTVNPSAVYHTGDLVNDGRLEADWDTFNLITAPIREAFDFYPALGNHEHDDSLYYNNFELPGNERWYSVTEDNIHFIILDSNSPSHDSSEQYLWLENHLMTLGDSISFTAAVFHHPPYSTGPHVEDEKNLRDTFVPLFEKYGVDIVFNGHDHCYERSFVNGIYYIVAGGGGAPCTFTVAAENSLHIPAPLNARTRMVWLPGWEGVQLYFRATTFCPGSGLA